MTSVAFLIWPIVGIIFRRSMAIPAAIAAILIGGYLLLPPGGEIALPLLPSISKATVPAFTALVIALIAARGTSPEWQPGWLPRSPLILACCALLAIGPLVTAITNTDTLYFGPRVLPAMRLYDGLSILQNLLVSLIPFLLARKFFATPENQRTLLLVLVIGAMGYTFLALYEIRMSPQLNNIVYGFFPHEWLQHRRGGSWRPIVFMHHGLWLGIFFTCATLAAFALWRTGKPVKETKYLLMGGWLFLVLLLSKTLGAFLIALVVLPILLLFSFRIQLLFASAVAFTLLTYPALRAADLVPTQRILSVAEWINPERAGSLAFRFEHEDLLLDRARERPVFGWGGWGRSRAYDQEGRDIAVTDGRWLIELGLGGWARYIAVLGLLTLPTLIMTLRFRQFVLRPETVAISVILAANLIDLLPNAGMSPITLMLAGALAGRLELNPATVDETEDRRTSSVGEDFQTSGGRHPLPTPRTGAVTYTRFPTEPGRRQ